MNSTWSPDNDVTNNVYDVTTKILITFADRRRRWPAYFRIAYDLRDYFWPAILVIGTFGNLMSAIVYSRPSMRASTSALYFRALSLTEMAFVILTLAPSLADRRFGDERIESTDWSCRIWNFTTFMLRDSASWILVLLSLERLVCVLVPHKIKLWLTKTRAKISIAAVFLIMGGFNSPFFVMMRSSYKKSAKAYLCIIRGRTEGWKHFGSYIWPWIDFLLYSLIPLILMFIANIGIIIVLTNAQRKRIQSTNTTNRNISSLTVSLVTVCISYTILSLPLCVRYLLNLKLGFMKDGLLFFAQTCSYLNHSINFFLYCLSGTRFRHELKKMFCKESNEDNSKSTQCASTVSSQAKTQTTPVPNDAVA